MASTLSPALKRRETNALPRPSTTSIHDSPRHTNDNTLLPGGRAMALGSGFRLVDSLATLIGVSIGAIVDAAGALNGVPNGVVGGAGV